MLSLKPNLHPQGLGRNDSNPAQAPVPQSQSRLHFYLSLGRQSKHPKSTAADNSAHSPSSQLAYLYFVLSKGTHTRNRVWYYRVQPTVHTQLANGDEEVRRRDMEGIECCKAVEAAGILRNRQPHSTHVGAARRQQQVPDRRCHKHSVSRAPSLGSSSRAARRECAAARRIQQHATLRSC